MLTARDAAEITVASVIARKKERIRILKATYPDLLSAIEQDITEAAKRGNFDVLISRSLCGFMEEVADVLREAGFVVQHTPKATLSILVAWEKVK